MRTIDITAINTQIAMENTGSAVGVAVTKMVMSAGERNGEQIVDMMRAMELSVNPNLGTNIDIRI